jgi:hypothetical protein
VKRQGLPGAARWRRKAIDHPTTGRQPADRESRRTHQKRRNRASWTRSHLHWSGPHLHRSMPHHHRGPTAERRAARRRRGYARLLRGSKGQLSGKVVLDRLGDLHVVVGCSHCRGLGRERDVECLVTEGSNDSLAPFARRLLHESRQIGDPLGNRKTSDRAYGLLAIQGVDPRSGGMRDDQPDHQNEQGLAEKALGKKPAHS